MIDTELLKARAIETRDKYLAGLITNVEAQKELKDYIDLFNSKTEEIANKYGQKPKKFRLSDFLRSKWS